MFERGLALAAAGLISVPLYRCPGSRTTPTAVRVVEYRPNFKPLPSISDGLAVTEGSDNRNRKLGKQLNQLTLSFIYRLTTAPECTTDEGGVRTQHLPAVTPASLESTGKSERMTTVRDLTPGCTYEAQLYSVFKEKESSQFLSFNFTTSEYKAKGVSRRRHSTFGSESLDDFRWAL